MKAKRLPIGWREIPPTWNDQDAGTPQEDWKATANPRHPRKEVRCWARGDRYVRLCEVVGDGQWKWALHVGFTDDDRADTVVTQFSADSADAEMETAALKLMQLGGYPR